MPPPVDVLEPVGGGDAFAAGYLYGRRLGRPPGVALAAGHRLARAALQSGDDLGAPVSPAELEAAMQA
ncbi:MAG: PfkB family carbohydrate kinase [Sporichthyaceae bacterium]